jgi:AraC family transcriptional regulator, arabinose operon regulatory protein
MDSTALDMDETPMPPTFEIRGHLHAAADLPRRWVVVPPAARSKALAHPILGGLLPSHVGFFPEAAQHKVERPRGVEQAIFTYCVRGAGWCDTGAGRIPVPVRAGDLVVVPPRAPHSYGSSAERPWTVHWVHVGGRYLGAMLRELRIGAGPTVVRVGRDARLIALFQDLERTLEDDYAFPQLLYASQILGHLIGLAIRLRHRRPDEGADAVERVRQSAERMKERLDAPLDVAQLASFANLSSSHYSTIFRRVTGSSPKAYFQRLRLHRAGRLLLTSRHSVKTIAAMMGYGDPLYFSRVFRRVHGVSPSDYRAAAL